MNKSTRPERNQDEQTKGVRRDFNSYTKNYFLQPLVFLLDIPILLVIRKYNNRRRNDTKTKKKKENKRT